MAAQPKPQPAPQAHKNGAPPPQDLASTISPGLRVIIMVTIMAATLMEVLDTSIVNVALPDMMGNLGATLDQIGWVSTGYIISNVIVLPLTGWLSDFFGRKMYLTYSIILFTVASFFCGTSGSLASLVIWRVIQGAGGAAFLSTSQATLIEIFPPNRRGFAQALFGIGVIAAPTLGPTVGGFITDRFSWPWIFYVNVPIGIFAAIMTVMFVPNSANAGKRRRVDILGIGFLAIGLGSLQTVLERGESEDWFATTYIAALALASVIALGLFIWWELRPANKNPAVNLRVVKNRNLAAGTIYAFALGFLLYGAVFVLPQFLQNVQAHTAEQAGLLLMPGGLAAAAMMPIVGALSNRIDSRFLIGAGGVLFVLSMLMFANRLTINIPDEAMYLPMALRGASTGLQFVPLSLVALGTLPPNQVAEGSGFYNLFRQLGGSFGIALLATLIDRRQHFHYGRLGEYLDVFSPVAQDRLNQIQTALMGKGMTASAAKTAAYATLNGTLQRQAIVMTYVDVFKFMEWMGLGAVLLIFLFKRPNKKNAAASAAAH